MLLCCAAGGVSEHTGPVVESSSALMLMKDKSKFTSLCNCINFKSGQVHHRQASELSLMLFLAVFLMCQVWTLVVETSEYSKRRDYFYMQGKNSTARVVRVFKQSGIAFRSMRQITH